MRPERSIPPVSDVFRNATEQLSSGVLLPEVQKLYDGSQSVYRNFCNTLHQSMKLPDLVNMAMKCNLNDVSLMLDDVSIVSTEPTVIIPPSIMPGSTLQALSSTVPEQTKNSKIKPGRTRKNGMTTAFAFTRHEILDQLMVETETDARLMAFWRDFDPSAETSKPFEPIPMEASLRLIL